MSTNSIFVDLTQQLTRRAKHKTNSCVCFLVASTLLSARPVSSSVQDCLPEAQKLDFLILSLKKKWYSLSFILEVVKKVFCVCTALVIPATFRTHE